MTERSDRFKIGSHGVLPSEHYDQFSVMKASQAAVAPRTDSCGCAQTGETFCGTEDKGPQLWYKAIQSPVLHVHDRTQHLGHRCAALAAACTQFEGVLCRPYIYHHRCISAEIGNSAGSLRMCERGLLPAALL